MTIFADDCPLGNLRGNVFTNSQVTCDGISAYNCYSEYVEKACCDTCPQFYQAELEPNCIYGDKTDW